MNQHKLTWNNSRVKFRTASGTWEKWTDDSWILGMNFYMSKSCISTFKPPRALVSFLTSCVFSNSQLKLRQNQTQTLGMIVLKRDVEVKRWNSCDDKFSAEDTYVEAQWWVIIKHYRTGSANAVRTAAPASTAPLYYWVKFVLSYERLQSFLHNTGISRLHTGGGSHRSLSKLFW